MNSAAGSFGLSFGLAFAGAIMLATLSLTFTHMADASTVLTAPQQQQVSNALEDDAEVMSNTKLEELLVGQPKATQAEIIRINTDARHIALQVALLIPILAGLIGLFNSFRMMRLPTPPLKFRRRNGPRLTSEVNGAGTHPKLTAVAGLRVLTSYEVAWLPKDVVAGLVLTTLLVPQGMAYAELAGLPAITGLYTSILCLIGYAVFGPSRILVLGPDSSLGPMIAATILPLLGANGDPTRAVALASMLALMVGAVMLLGGAARLGSSPTCFRSQP